MLPPPRTPIDPHSGHRLSRTVLAPPPSEESDFEGEEDGERFLRRELNRAYVTFKKSDDELSGVTPTAAVATGWKFNKINIDRRQNL